MTETDLTLDPLADLIRDAGRPVHLNRLTRRALRSRLQTRAEQRQYAPGAHYEPGERIRFAEQWVAVTAVQVAGNPAQGKFSVLTLTLPDGSVHRLAADVPGAPGEELSPVTQQEVDRLTEQTGDETRRALRAALEGDPRFVSCSTLQGELWCLAEMAPTVTPEEQQLAEDVLPAHLIDGELISGTTRELTAAIWGLEDDGTDDYALYAFALRRALGHCNSIVNLGDSWARADAWEALRTERERLASPRQACRVELPDGVAPASTSEIADEESLPPPAEEQPEPETSDVQDLEVWRRDHPDHAIFVLRARHYCEGWLPFGKHVRRLFPPLGIGQQLVTFHHHFGEEPESFPAYVDRDQARILLSPQMYETFRHHRIYPGARLRLSVRDEQEFDLTTRPTDKTEPVRIWRMWLNEDGEVEYEDFEEPRRYDIDDDVYVADVRFEDREALFRQAEETGNSIFGLMYHKAVEWWEENDRESLVVTSDQLHEAIHFDERGRMVSKATVQWELWKRLAFKPLGGGRYRFRPEFGEEVRAAVPRPEVQPADSDPIPEAPAYFIFQQRPDSEYDDRLGEVYNWRKGIPGSLQIVEGARFIYYRPGEQVFFGTGRVASIDTYVGEDGETYYNGHISDCEYWCPPLPLTADLAEEITFVDRGRLSVGQAGIRQVSQKDFEAILSARHRATRALEPSVRFWTYVKQLAGQSLYTLDQNKPFEVIDVDDQTIRLEVDSGSVSVLGRADLEQVWNHLTVEGEVLRIDIEEDLPFSSSHAAAILAALPQVEYRIRPIRLIYQPEMASSLASLAGEVPPVTEEAPNTVANRRVKQLLSSWGPVRAVTSAGSRSLLEVGGLLFWLRYSRFHEDAGYYWFGIPKGHFQAIKSSAEVLHVLMICGHPDRTLVIPFEFLKSTGITCAPVNSSGHWILYVYPSNGGFDLANWSGSGERKRVDVTHFLNKYPFEEVVSGQPAEELALDTPVDAVGRPEPTGSGQLVATGLAGPGPLFEKPPAETGGDEGVEGAESVSDGSGDQGTQPRIDAELEQIRMIVEEQLAGDTIYTLAQRKPNKIAACNSEGLTVVTQSGEAQVRWQWIEDVYAALFHLGEIEPKDVQEGEFRTPGGYRNAFIFALLARFDHVEARTKPRNTLIYHEPDGPIRLADVADDDDLPEPPPSPPDSPAPASPPPTKSRTPVSPSTEADTMQTKSLFSQHYLHHRLPDHPEWREDPRPAFEAVHALWQRAREYGDTWNESQTEQEFIQPVLELLGWTYIVQPTASHAGRVRRPDYALFPDDRAKDEAMPHQGDDAAFYSRASVIAEAKYWGRPMSQKDSGGREAWDAQTNPSHQMVSYLVGTRVGWGILTNGPTWRLYSREVSSTASEYYEIDLASIFASMPEDAESMEEEALVVMEQFRRWWLFFRQRSFVPDAEGRSFVERIRRGSETYARRISDTLKKLVYEEVMPEIAGGFVAYRYYEGGVEGEIDESLRDIYRASLSLLYKLLFLLYGEARALLPVDHPSYQEQSVTALAQWAAERIDKGLPISDATHATGRYDTLRALFRRIDQGDPSLGIPRYDGGLFDPSSPENQFLETHKLSDRAVARAIDTLVRDAGEPVDYAYIGVQNLGSIYEGLLENRLHVVDAAAGQVELISDQGERKATGSYYTPDYIVEYIVQNTLDPILEERDEAFRGAMDRAAELRGQLQRVADAATVRRLRNELDVAERDAREAFLGIKVLDPAMGSGHFLVNAVDHLTDAIIRRMQVYHDEHAKVLWDWNPIQRLIEHLRTAILGEMQRQGIQLDPSRLDDTALLTRLVMKRCIYGVDLNRMAVELAKLSLWLHTFTVGAPLSFLDHHLRWGNSLIGTDVRTVEEQIRKTGAGQLSLWQGPFAGLLDLTGLMVEVVERTDATLADVQKSAEIFKQFRRELTPYKQVLDLWVSQYFGNELAEEFLTVHGADVLPALKGKQGVPAKYEAAIAEARALYEDKRFFHWDLEFPEVFVDLRGRDWAQNPGFDAVIGNPPYFSIATLSSEDVRFLDRAYPDIFSGNSDILYYFLGQADALPKQGGLIGMIVGRYFQEAKYAARLRQYLSESTALVRLVDFANLQVFGSGVNVLASIVILRRARTGSQDREAQILRLVDENAEVERVANSLLKGDGLFESFFVPSPRGDQTWSFRHPRVAAISRKMMDCSACLGRIARVVQSMQTGRNEILAPGNPTLRAHSIEDHLINPIAKAGSIERYEFEDLDKSIIWTEGVDLDEYPHAKAYLLPFKDELASRYDIRNRGAEWWEISNPRNADLFFSGRPRILVPFIATGNKFCVDTEKRLNDGGDVRAIFFDGDRAYSEYYVCAILNSRLCEYYHLRHTKLKRGGYYEYFEGQLSSLPIRYTAFTTPPEQRERLSSLGARWATQWVETTEGGSVESVSFSAFSGSDFGRWLDERLSPVHTPDPELVRQHNADPLNEDWQLPEEGPVEQSDVVHDLLAHLAEQMIDMHKEKQSRIETFWLDLEGVTDPSVYDTLRNRGKWESSLWKAEPCRGFVAEESRSTVHLDESLGWNEACFKAFVKMLAGNVSNLSEVVSVYRKHHRDYGQLVWRIAATDRLIDLIVYRLYGLTAEEVAVVEGKSP